MWRYELKPGPAADSAVSWPADAAGLKRTVGPTLVMFLHPDCPCSRASLTELQTLAARYPALAVNVVFVHRPGMSDPSQSTLWKTASTIASATLINDDGGNIARCFSANTSGQVFVYDADGMLRFAGGITASRGHVGGNDGADSIAALLESRSVPRTSHPVYGCRLY